MTYKQAAELIRITPDYGPIVATLFAQEGHNHKGWQKVDNGLAKEGIELHPAFWPCPLCNIRWYDCSHTIQEAYPTTPPWKEKDAIR